MQRVLPLVEIPLDIVRKVHPTRTLRKVQYFRRLSVHQRNGFQNMLFVTFDGVSLIVEKTGLSEPDPAYRAVQIPSTMIPLKDRHHAETSRGIRWMSWHK